MKAVRFLLGVLADHFEREQKEDERIEKLWRSRMDGLEETLPEPDERSTEQWEELVRLTGELYYAMAAHANTRSAAVHLSNYRDALEELEGRR